MGPLPRSDNPSQGAKPSRCYCTMMICGTVFSNDCCSSRAVETEQEKDNAVLDARNIFKEAERDFNKVSVDNVVFSSVTLF